MRGRHTKKQREEAKRDRLQYVRKKTNCRECDAPHCKSIDSSDGTGTVCTVCGITTHEPSMQHTFEQVVSANVVGNPSPPYAHRNYFGERMAQFLDNEPRLTDQEALDIVSVYVVYRKHFGEEWKACNLTKPHIAELLRSLSRDLPSSRYHCRLERWVQIINLLGGSIVNDHSIAMKLRIMFDAITETFAASHRFTRKKKNIPRIDIISLLMLYSISDEALAENGWYFLNKDIIMETPSSITNWKRAVKLLEDTNIRYSQSVHLNKKISTVRQETRELFARTGFLFKFADMDTLTNISFTDSNQRGLNTLKKYLTDLSTRIYDKK